MEEELEVKNIEYNWMGVFFTLGKFWRCRFHYQTRCEDLSHPLPFRHLHRLPTVSIFHHPHHFPRFAPSPPTSLSSQPSYQHANPQQCNSLPCAPLKIPPLPRTRLVHLDFRYGSRAKCERCVYNPIFARSSRGRVLSGDCVPHRVVVHKNRAWQAVLTVRHGWIAGRLCQRRDASRAAQDDERNVGVERVGFWGAWGKCLERSYRSRGVVINYITKFGRGGCNRFVTDYTHVHGRPGAVAVIQLTPKRRYSIKPTFLLKMALALRFRWHHHYCSRRRRLLPPPRLPCQHDLALRRGTRPSYRSSRARRQEHTSCGFLVAAPASHVWDVAPVRVCVHMGVPARVVGGDMATWACGEEAWREFIYDAQYLLQYDLHPHERLHLRPPSQPHVVPRHPGPVRHRRLHHSRHIRATLRRALRRVPFRHTGRRERVAGECLEGCWDA
ncbi:hypothetical protein BC936DRAFT_139014 [Jimgerdemannia flammicorona]|uniref:Uncharacterized protein n=1 Tax=Jimgerdemannia flammicorona TaxID=994334 RepID=A0A433BAU8_9FUNG|nr:hypothetical protein BC936DRAFT_139014 [Jimgerdemannia flammicorona]